MEEDEGPVMLYGERYKLAVHPLARTEIDHAQTLDFPRYARWYEDVAAELTTPEKRYLGAVDRFWLLTELCGRVDMVHHWLYDRCREVQADPDERLDLWSREHYKSTIITFGGILQEVINDPDITVGIFAFNKPTAAAFLRQLQQEMEANDNLKALYPDVFWPEPKKEAPLWNRDKGLVVKRASNPKEATIEAHGLVDGQPTSKHYRLRVYDDIVTRESVTTPEMIRKVTEAWELSDNLGAVDPKLNRYRRWHAGTRYHFGDTYGIMIERGILRPRIYPATHNGKESGNPVLWTPEVWATKKKTQRSTMAAQLLLNPLGNAERVFEPTWFQPYEVIPAIMNVYIMVDPSRGRTASSDRTAMAVVGVTEGGTKYLLDGYRHRMKLSERWSKMRDLYKKWLAYPGVQTVKVGYERFGQTSDDEYFQERMREEKIAFNIEELAWPREGSASKAHRIERLEPDIRQGRFLLPAVVYHEAYRDHDGAGVCLWKVENDHMAFRPLPGHTKAQKVMADRGLHHRIVKPIRRIDENREAYDLTRALFEELTFFPFAPKDDLADVASRIYDLEPVAPINYDRERRWIETPDYIDA